MIVCKFGGTSMADAKQMKKVQEIIDLDPRREIVVVSAPGKRSKDDEKITDLFYHCQKDVEEGRGITPHFSIIRERIEGIARDLGLTSSYTEVLDEIENRIASGASADYAASRGEYLSGLLMAELLSAEFIDPEETVKISYDGRVEEETYRLLSSRLKEGKRYVLPGFFGSDPDGKVKTFSRGGSDISGAIAARAAAAECYENWTDVSGILMADPRIVDDPSPVPEISYREVRELASIGASVFHEEAIAPVRSVGVPIQVRNTNDPEASGTMILPARDIAEKPVVGVSGKKPYKRLYIEKLMLSRYRGFHEKVMAILQKAQVEAEFESRGFDSYSFLISEESIKDEEALLLELKKELEPDDLAFRESLALIGLVGDGLLEQSGIASHIFEALRAGGVNVRFINYGGSEICLLLGVELKDYEKALRLMVKAVS